jgi:hypothetical protein
MDDGSKPNYIIADSGRNIAQFRGSYRLAEKLNLGQIVIRAYREIVEKLQTDPTGWGEPAGYLEVLQVQLYDVVTPLFRIQYGVDEARRIVYIKDVHFFLQEQ